jgi:hypothetical protein
MRLALSIVGAAVLGAVVSLPASAASGDATFALIPQHYDPALAATQSYFVAVARPGKTFTNSVRVRNLGGRAGTVLLYAVDATTGKTSGAVYLERTKPRRGVGSWVTLGAQSVTLAPGESRVVPVSVHVPDDARPGDHLGGIVAENAALTTGGVKGSLRINIRHLTIAAVLVQVPGPASAAVAVTAARAGGEHGYQYVYLHLENTGALMTKPTGRLTVLDSNGKTDASRAFEFDTFVPGTAIGYPVLLPHESLAPGDYRAKITLTYGAAAIGYRRKPGKTHTVTRTLPFTVSGGEYAHVFSGARPLAPAVTTHAATTWPLTLWLLVGVAALAAGAVVVLAVRVRRPA